jgi:acetoacetyl-CoA reductase/3-oxoacyl-[acyl-carrier protein] reductase
MANYSILITGASQGIGKYLFEEFHCKGHKVFGTYNKTQPQRYEEFFSKVDVNNSMSLSNWISSIASTSENFVLINCAGITYNSFAHKTNLDEWNKVIDINIKGTFNAIHAILPYMREKGFGRIINFSSVVAQMGVPGTSAYSASKSALWGLTKTLAAENASKGITVNSLNLGYFDIGMIKDVPQAMLNKIMESIPAKALGNPVNIFNAVRFLIDSDYVNGTHIDINGGLF